MKKKERLIKLKVVSMRRLKIIIIIIKLTNLYQTQKQKREKNQNKIRNEKGEVTTDNAEIQGIKRDYYELYDNKMDKLE